MPRVIGIVVVVLIALAVKLFTVDQGEVLKFNDTTVDILNKYEDPFEPLFVHFAPYFEGEQVNVEQIRQALTTVRSTVGTMNSEIQGLSVPDAELCKNFHSSVVAFAKMHETACDQIDTVLEYVATHNPPSDADTQEVLSQL
jgi:hypothetical protein